MTPDLRRHYRRLIIVCTVPLSLVILALGVFQFHSQRASELDGLRQMAIAQQLALNQVAESARDHVELLRRWSQQALARPLDGPVGVPQLDDVIGDPARLAARDPGEAAMLQGLYRLIELAHPTAPILERSYYYSAANEVLAFYPPRGSWQIERADPTEAAALFARDGFRRVEPSADPYRRGHWGGPEPNVLGPGRVLSYTAPLYRNDRFTGAVAADLRLDFLTGLLQSMHYPAGRLWLVDRTGRMLADTDGRTITARRAAADIEQLPFAPEVLEPAASGRFRMHDDQQLLALPLSAAPWTLVYAVSERELAGLLLPRLLPYGVILAGLCLTLGLIQWLLRRRFINPALALVHYIGAEAEHTGDDGTINDRRPPDAPRLPPLWQPWLEIIARTFRNNRAYLRRVRDSEALKSAIIDSALDAVITIDERSAIVEFNPSAERLFGYRRKSVLGRPLAEIILPSSRRQQHDAEACRCLDTTDLRLLGRRNELTAIRADGRRFPVEIALAEVKLAERRLFTAYIRDLSQQKRAERQIAHQREMLHQSEKLSALGSLLAGVAHELNNPLSIVVGRAIMLENETASSQFAGSIRKIREAAERCARIVKTFVSIARQRPPTPAPVQINSLIESVVDMLGYGLRKHGIELELRLQADLPELWADADQLSQVLMNLIVNAQQAMQQHDRPARLLLSTRFDPASGRVQASIRDTGPGIPEELRSRIFEPFYTTKGPGVGLGVGLSVSHAIIHSHHGVLSADNNPDGGACFTISLPLRLPEEQQPPRRAAR